MKRNNKQKQLRFEVHVQTTDYEIRTEEVRGTEYWIVPVVMMVEGVHHGSRGPMLYTEEELAASVASWNGMPVTIGHPQDEEGSYISANVPDVLEGIVGRIYNPKMNDSKLTAEAWIDINSLAALSPEAFEYIKEKKALDVSVGVFSSEVKGEGEFNGESYRAEAVNLTPDHLALLPGETGACSWDDGCGIRLNSKQNMKKGTESKKVVNIDDKTSLVNDLLKEGYKIMLIDNDSSFADVMRSIQDKLNKMDSDMRVNYLEEVYDDYFIYCVVNRENGERLLYKRGYSIKNDGAVELVDEPIKVRKEVSFVNMKRTNFKSNTKMKVKVNSKCSCTVDSLIQNEATKFSEDDREWLSTLSQEQLDKLAPEEVEAPPVANKKAAVSKATDKPEGPAVVVNEDGSISINGKNLSEHIKESLANEKDPSKFIDTFMPPVLANQMKSGLKMYQSRREKLVKEIAANSKFKEEQLKNWSDEDLEALHATVAEEEQEGGNYAPLSTSFEKEEEEVTANEVTAMLSFEREAPKK